MIKKVAFTMYPVENMTRARQFYEEILQLKPGIISSQGQWEEYDLPEGGCFALTTLATGVTPSANAGGTIAFEVANLDECIIQLKTKQVKLKLDTFATAVCKMAVIIDSEGNAVTLHQLFKK